MASVGSDLENVLVGEREHWLEGPPHELFKEMRAKCPVHWTDRLTEFPEEAGFWSVTTAEDIHARITPGADRKRLRTGPTTQTTPHDFVSDALITSPNQGHSVTDRQRTVTKPSLEQVRSPPTAALIVVRGLPFPRRVI